MRRVQRWFSEKSAEGEARIGSKEKNLAVYPNTVLLEGILESG